jgi:hypothetical protein
MAKNEILIYLSIFIVIMAWAVLVCSKTNESFDEPIVKPPVATAQVATIAPPVMLSSPPVPEPAPITWYNKCGQGMTGEPQYDIIYPYKQDELIYACNNIGAVSKEKWEKLKIIDALYYIIMARVNTQAKLLKVRDDDIFKPMLKKMYDDYVIQKLELKNELIQNKLTLIRTKLKQDALANAQEIKEDTKNNIITKFTREQMQSGYYNNFPIPRRVANMRDICNIVNMTYIDDKDFNDRLSGMVLVYNELQNEESIKKLQTWTPPVSLEQIQECKVVLDEILFDSTRKEAEKTVALIVETTKDIMQKEINDYVNAELLKAHLKAQLLAQEEEMQKTIIAAQAKKDASIGSRLSRFFKFGKKQ